MAPVQCVSFQAKFHQISKMVPWEMEAAKNSEFQFALFEMYFRQPDLSTYLAKVKLKTYLTFSNNNSFPLKIEVFVGKTALS